MNIKFISQLLNHRLLLLESTTVAYNFIAHIQSSHLNNFCQREICHLCIRNARYLKIIF